MTSHRPLLRIAATTWFALSIVGCATWNSSSVELAQLPLPALAPETVVLEVVFVRLPPEQPGVAAAIWKEIDEQHFSHDVRHRLVANGVRCGLVNSPLPPTLRHLVDQQPSDASGNKVTAAPEDEVTAHRQRLHSRTGSPGKIVARNEPEGMLSLLTTFDGRVQGQSFDQPQCVFVVKTEAQGDGRVHIELTPEVEYGQTRPRYVGNQGVWSLDTSREKQSYPRLRIEADLHAGQSLMLGTTADSKGLGSQFFSRSDSQGGHQTLLLIRLQQTQLDDRFSPDAAEFPSG